jgi:hypothetical protein
MDAFVDRGEAAERKQQDRDDERPEEGLAAVTERVVLGRRLARSAVADQQQNLVRAIDEAMDRFRRQGHAARNTGADRFSDDDPEVREERGQDDSCGSIGFHRASLALPRARSPRHLGFWQAAQDRR